MSYNTPKGSPRGISKILTIITKTTDRFKASASKLLGPDSSLERKAGALIDLIEITASRVGSILPGKGDNSKSVIESFLNTTDGNGINEISIEDLNLPAGMKPGEYSHAISSNWGDFILHLLHENSRKNPDKIIKGRRFSQSLKSDLKDILPEGIQDLAIKSYSKKSGKIDFNNDLFHQEIISNQDIFLSTLNLILRINVLLNNPTLGELISNLLWNEKLYEGLKNKYHSTELSRIAFLIQVLELGLLDKLLDPQILREIIITKLQGLKIEYLCITAQRQIYKSEKEENPDYTESYDISRRILKQFSKLYCKIGELKKKADGLQIQRQVVGNLLNIDVGIELASKIFDENSPLYKLIFLNLLTAENEKDLNIAFSTEFKTFLLRLISKFPKVSHSNESGTGFSYFYTTFIHLYINENLDKEKENRILSFLNSVGNINKNMNFCMFIILGDLEDIQMMPYLNEEDRTFIESNFDIDINNPREKMTSGQALRELDYSDLSRLQTLGPKELEHALNNITNVKSLFEKERIRDSVTEDRLWLPKNILGYDQLEGLIGEDIEMQELDELRKKKELVYDEYEIGAFATLHRIILADTTSLEDRGKSLQDIGNMYLVLSSSDNNVKRKIISEIYELPQGKRSIAIGFIKKISKKFDFQALSGNIGELVNFIESNNFINEPSATIWDLFLDDVSKKQKKSGEKEESDASIFIEVFGEHLGLKIAVLKLADSVNEVLLSIGTTLNTYHAASFVEFIESKKGELKVGNKQHIEKLRNILSFSVLISNHGLYNLENIVKYYLEIWNLDVASDIIQDISHILEGVNIHKLPEIEKYLYQSILQGDTISLQKYITTQNTSTSIESGNQSNTEEKIHVKLGSSKPAEVARKIEFLGYERIKTKSGHNKYRGVNRDGVKVMIILPFSKGDVNKYILQQIVAATGLTIAEWEEL